MKTFTIDDLCATRHRQELEIARLERALAAARASFDAIQHVIHLLEEQPKQAPTP